MFAKSSRYRAVPDVTVPDAKGRTIQAKDARELPDVTGTYLHTVVAGDRLDRLAWTYHGEPQQFWRICDANPEFLSPFALIGQEPVTTTRFPVVAGSGAPPWAAVIAALTAWIGVDGVAVTDDVRLETERHDIGGEQVQVTVERPVRALTVTYNRVRVGPDDLAGVIEAAGFRTGPPEDLGPIGRQIVVPVAAGG